jgi:hypothetical protein
MSIVGYAAASGIFLDIHPFLRALAQTLNNPEGLELRLSGGMYAEVERVHDPEDATEQVAEYYQAWWKRHFHWKTESPVLVDMWAAIDFHTAKVSLFRTCLCK